METSDADETHAAAATAPPCAPRVTRPLPILGRLRLNEAREQLSGEPRAARHRLLRLAPGGTALPSPLAKPCC